MKHESFIKGTIILIIANAVSKILGAVLKIPLTYILGEQGMAIYHTAFSVYIMLLSLITSGLPFSVSKYISEELALSNKGNVRFAMRFSVLIMCILGFLASCIMFLGADFFALAMKDPKSPLAIKVIAPSIFFVALGAPYKSCFQGYAHQTPTATSQVIESFIKLIAGYYLAVWFSAFSVKYTSAAAISGVTIGELFATLLLILLYIPYRRETCLYAPETPRRKIVSALTAVAVPMTAVSVISGSLALLETSIIRNRLTTIVFTEETARSFLLRYSSHTSLFDNLMTVKKLSFDGARWLFGSYSGYAATVFNLPAGILAAFGVSILPIVTRSLTLNDFPRLEEAVHTTAKIILALSLPASAVMCFFASPILEILFKNTASSLMLSLMAPLLVPVSLIQFLYAVEHSAGKIMTPFLCSLFSTGITLLLSYILIHIPSLNILGAIISSIVADSLLLILSIRLLKRNFSITFLHFFDVLKILLSTGAMSAVAILLYNPLCIILKSTTLGFFLSLSLSACVYIGMLFLFNVITKEEMLCIRH